MSARTYLNDVEEQLVQAQRLIDALQREVLGGLPLGANDNLTINRTTLWHRLESIDDKVHEALGKLGD